MKRTKIGLVLGGGGARGLAHIGVIKRLTELGLSIDVITGASMGAIIGAAYAQTRDIGFIESRFRTFMTGKEYQSIKGRALDLKEEKADSFLHFISKTVKRRIVINLAANRMSLVSDKFLNNTLTQLLTDEPIESLKIPFACTALDLVSGRETVFRRGSVLKAVQASAAIPGFLPPVSDDGKRLVDGAVINNFPIEAAKSLGADFTIACDVSPELEPDPPLNNVIDIFIRAHHAAVNRLKDLLVQKADVLLKPNIGSINWMDFEQIDTLIKQGEAVVDENKALIMEKLAAKQGFWQRLKSHLLSTN